MLPCPYKDSVAEFFVTVMQINAARGGGFTLVRKHTEKCEPRHIWWVLALEGLCGVGSGPYVLKAGNGVAVYFNGFEEHG